MQLDNGPEKMQHVNGKAFHQGPRDKYLQGFVFVLVLVQFRNMLQGIHSL